jgi:hypothetical protein
MNIRCIKSMRSIKIKTRTIRDMVNYFVVLLHFVGVGFGELDESFTIVHSWVVLVSHLVPYVILDMRISCIQVCTPFMLNLFTFNGLLLLLVRLRLMWLLGDKLNDGWSLLKFIHHISTVILRWLHFCLFVQVTYHLLKNLDSLLQVVIFLSYGFITSFHTHLTCVSFMVIWWLRGVWSKSIKLHFKIFMSLLQDIIWVLKSTTWVFENRIVSLLYTSSRSSFSCLSFSSFKSFLSFLSLSFSWISNFSCSSRRSSWSPT